MAFPLQVHKMHAAFCYNILMCTKQSEAYVSYGLLAVAGKRCTVNISEEIVVM